MKKFKCPNCKKTMEFEEQTKFRGEIYDKWECEDCVHIVLLDFRGETHE